MKNISMIVAMGQNNEIGKDNQLLWHISDDLKRFKKYTTGNVIVMGRKTFESLPKGALPNRVNIVLSSEKEDKFPGASVVRSIDEALLQMSSDHENFIIGGGQIYNAFFPFVQKIYLTRVPVSLEADTFFPPLSEDDWEIEYQEDIPAGEKNEYPHRFQILKRK